MYQFKDTVVDTTSEAAFVPSDNMMINGTGLNELVPGYRQLSVSGRGLVSRRVNTTEIPNRGGIWIDDVQDEAREIKIYYQLTAKSSEALRECFWQLNKVLRSSSTLSISFKDEPEFIYFATYSEAEDFQENHLSIISNFTLLCANPNKQTNIQRSTNGSVLLKYATKVLPKKIQLKVIEASNEIQVSCANQKLTLKGTYAVGDSIVFDYLDTEVEIRKNKRLILNDLAIHQPLEKFHLVNGSTVQATHCRVELVEWRDERL